MNKIYIAGHQGMVGSAIVRALLRHGIDEKNIIGRTRGQLDLTHQAKVSDFFQEERPDQVFLAAAKVGGIHANNTYPADFMYDNLMEQSNVIDAAYRAGVKKLLFLGSPSVSIDVRFPRERKLYFLRERRRGSQCPVTVLSFVNRL